MTASVELRLEGPMDHLRIAWQAGESLLGTVQFEDDAASTRYHILLAMQELLTNVFRHGYQSTTGRSVVVVFTATEHAFEFEIRDQAPRFDPTVSVERPEVEDDDDAVMPEEAGGYGLMIVQTVMDDVDYRFEDGWNVLKATKHVSADVRVVVTEESF